MHTVGSKYSCFGDPKMHITDWNILVSSQGLTMSRLKGEKMCLNENVFARNTLLPQ